MRSPRHLMTCQAMVLKTNFYSEIISARACTEEVINRSITVCYLGVQLTEMSKLQGSSNPYFDIFMNVHAS